MNRTAEIERKTAETDIRLALSLDGGGKSDISTPCGFLFHMITLFARHGRFDIGLKCTGDTFVDYHHTAEDTGIVLGTAFKTALGDKRGIKRYGSIILPMDEALILSSVDISGRAHLSFDVRIPTEKVGDFDTELVQEFWLGFVRGSEITLHIRQLAGDNSHHIIEGIFKACARAIREAVSADERAENEIPSTKGVL